MFPIIVIGIITPICEETFFRGFALPAFARRYGVWSGILLSAALFSRFHFSIVLVVPVFLFGIVRGGVCGGRRGARGDAALAASSVRGGDFTGDETKRQMAAAGLPVREATS